MVVTAAITWVALGVAYMAGVAGLLIAIAVGLSCPELAPVYASLVHRKERFDEGVRSSDCAGAVAATPPARDPALESSIGALDEPSLDVPDLMTVEDLCHAWRSSYVALQRAVTAESRMRIVGMRALYLDELERQAGREVRAWLSSGARAASDPGRFVTGSQDGLRAR
jgi:hypothetical protein